MESGSDHAAGCKLLVGPAAISAQVMLVGIVLLGLFYKRSKEVPPRPMLVWGMDVSKQLVSSGMAHILGMVIAMVAQLQATKQVTSECSWYFVVFSVDTTLGIMLVITMHNSCVRMAKQQLHKDCSGMSEWSSSDDEEMADDMEQQLTSQRHRTSRRVDWPWVYESIADCGSYGTPPSVAKWAIQLAQFSACVVAARLMCGTVVITLSEWLAHIAAVLDRGFRGHPTALLFFVMVACPCLMNIGQAWVQDHVLKWAGFAGGSALSPGTATPRRSGDDGDWAELGHLADPQASSGDLEEQMRASKVGVAGRVGSGDLGGRAAVAQRQKVAAADRRLRQ